MVNCVVTSCRNSSAKISKDKDGITFHRFPRNKERRRQWEIAVNREKDWSSSSASAVCSEHFKAENFYSTESGLRKLAINAVPTVKLSAPQTEPVAYEPPLNIESTDSAQVIQLKHKVRRLEIIAADRKRRLNLMWQGKRRLKKELEGVKRLVEHLIRIKKDGLNDSSNKV